MAPSLRWLRRTLITSIGVCGIAAVLAIFEVETVVGSGPALLVVAVALVVFATRARYLPALWLGVGHVGICTLFVALVNLLRWGPKTAAVPFAIMGSLYFLATAAWTVRMLLRLPEQDDPTRCTQCGYLLLKLTEPRCPECGTPFDPARLAELSSDPFEERT